MSPSEPLPYTPGNVASSAADPSSAAVDSHLDYIVVDIEVADMVLAHRPTVDIVQAGLAVAHMVAVHTVRVEERKVDYHNLHKNVCLERFVFHMHYTVQVKQQRAVLQEYSCSVHNEYKTRCLLAQLVDKLDKGAS